MKPRRNIMPAIFIFCPTQHNKNSPYNYFHASRFLKKFQNCSVSLFIQQSPPFLLLPQKPDRQKISKIFLGSVQKKTIHARVGHQKHNQRLSLYNFFHKYHAALRSLNN